MATIAASRSTPVSSPSASILNTSQSHPYTCNTCQVAFRSNELQRTHMRSDWHRYNLHRRVASLPSLSSEVFTEKVLASQASSTAAAAKASFEQTCPACQKTYYSKNAYQNHLKSQKHRLRIAVLQNTVKGTNDEETGSIVSSTFSLGEPINLAPSESIDTEAEAEFSEVVNSIKETTLHEKEPLSRRPSRPHHSSNEDRPGESESLLAPKKNVVSADKKPPSPSIDEPSIRCMFCNYDSPSLKLNVMHMSKYHGMFIPEQPYLVDLEGLIHYLYAKIKENHECLYCHKLKSSVGGVQTHMKDKGHCMIAFTTEEELIEVGQFYDFSSTYSDDADDDFLDEVDDANEISTNIKLRCGRSIALKTVICSANGDQEIRDGEEDAGGWETDTSVSSLDSADLTAIPIDQTQAFKRLPLHRHHSHTDPRPHRSVDGFHSHAHSHHAVFRSDYELYMPSGRTAGHRALSRYYRQNLHNYPTATEREERRRIENRPLDSHSDNGTVLGRDERGRQAGSRAHGGTGMLGVSEGKKREVRAVEQRERKHGERAQKQYQWGVDKRGNSQKHFRDPLLQ